MERRAWVCMVSYVILDHASCDNGGRYCDDFRGLIRCFLEEMFHIYRTAVKVTQGGKGRITAEEYYKFASPSLSPLRLHSTIR